MLVGHQIPHSLAVHGFNSSATICRDHSTMGQPKIFFGHLLHSFTLNECFKSESLVGCFLPLVTVICQPVEDSIRAPYVMVE